jgi:M6 family metalloprotease-like protein
VPVEFPDRAHDARFSTRDLEALLFSRGTYVKNSPTGEPVFGSVADYYDENSAGRFALEGKVFAWTRLAVKRAALEGTGWLARASGFARLLPEALVALEAREGAGALDRFDGVAFVVAGGFGPFGTVLWPHSAAVPWRGRLLRYYLMSETQREGPREEFAPVGVHCHEFGHVLGILDKYGEGPHAGLGIWCLMAIGGRGDRANGERRPLHLCAWCKEKLGWLAPATVDPRTPQTIRLRGVEGRAGEAVKVLIDPSGSEYFLLENRGATGFDRGVPRAGLLIWHVGEVGQSLRNGVFAYAIDLEEAHGDETAAGPFHDLERIPWPQSGQTAFTPWSHPDTTSWNPRALEVAITDIRREGEDVVLTIGAKLETPRAYQLW